VAIFIENMSECQFCGAVMRREAGVISFPAMTWNELDPLARVSDATVHTACMNASGLMAAAERRLLAVQQTTGPGRRQCMLCSEQVLTLEEHFPLGYFTEVESSPLYPFNLAQFHRECLGKWTGLQGLVVDLEEESASGRWRGSWLEHVIEQLNAMIGSRRSS
jgi:hypothetical protein